MALIPTRSLRLLPFSIVLVAVTACKLPPPPPAPLPDDVTLRSDAFEDGELIPERYTCDGEAVSPPLEWGEPPVGTQSWALECYDPDVTSAGLTLWQVYDIPLEVQGLPEGIGTSNVPILSDFPGSRLDPPTLQGANDRGEIGFAPPCPMESRDREFIYRIYALDIAQLGVGPGVSPERFRKSIEGHILGEGMLIGTLKQRPNDPSPDPPLEALDDQ